MSTLTIEPGQYEAVSTCEQLFADFLANSNIVTRNDIDYALAMQKAIFENGSGEIPSVLELLLEDQAIDSETATSVRGAYQKIREAGIPAMKEPVAKLEKFPEAETKDLSESARKATIAEAETVCVERTTTTTAVEYRSPVAPAPVRVRAVTTEQFDSQAVTTHVNRGKATSVYVRTPGSGVQRLESRVHPRFSITDAKVRFCKDSVIASLSNDGPLLPMVNLSRTGMCFMSDRKLDEGDKLRVMVYVPFSNYELKARAVVKQCVLSKSTSGHASAASPYRVRLKFSKLDAATIKQIEHLHGINVQAS